jgi:hypothetical protein
MLSLAIGGCGGKSASPKDGAVDKTPDANNVDSGSGDAPAEKVVDAPAEMAADAAGDVAAEVAPDVAADVSPEVNADAPLEGSPGSPLLVFNTGVDSNGVPLAGGSVDPHYTLIQSAEPTLPGPNAIVVTNIAAGYWLANSDTSKWIAPSANQSYPGADPCNAAGTYVYRTTFDLTGLDPSALRIAGKWGADNMGVAVRLNGTSLGLTAGGYNPLTDFTISSGFVAGKNTLDFEIVDTGCPNGLRVELTATTVTDASADSTSGQ